MMAAFLKLQGPKDKIGGDCAAIKSARKAATD